MSTFLILLGLCGLILVFSGLFNAFIDCKYQEMMYDAG